MTRMMEWVGMLSNVMMICSPIVWVWYRKRQSTLSPAETITINESILNGTIHLNQDNHRHRQQQNNEAKLQQATQYQHQVAGHTTEVLLCNDDRIYKPMIKEPLFIREVSVYEKMNESVKLYRGVSLLTFVPKYFGVVSKSTPNLHYIELENLTKGFVLPCVCDIKMGLQTYEPSASLNKIQREIKKYPHQEMIGFRITGFKVYDLKKKQFYFASKNFGRSLTPSDIVEGLSMFFHDGFQLRRQVIINVIEELERLHQNMTVQTRYNFYCSSLLIAYDANPANSFNRSRVDLNSIENRFHIPTHFPIDRLQDCLNRFSEDSLGSSTDCPEKYVSSSEVQSASVTNAIPMDVSSFHSKQYSINSHARVKLIDFAHTVVNSPTTIDDTSHVDNGYIAGLENLLANLYSLLQCDNISYSFEDEDMVH